MFKVQIQVGNHKEEFFIDKDGDAPELHAAKQAVETAIAHGHGSARTSPRAKNVVINVAELERD